MNTSSLEINRTARVDSIQYQTCGKAAEKEGKRRRGLGDGTLDLERQQKQERREGGNKEKSSIYLQHQPSTSSRMQ